MDGGTYSFSLLLTGYTDPLTLLGMPDTLRTTHLVPGTGL